MFLIFIFPYHSFSFSQVFVNTQYIHPYQNRGVLTYTYNQSVIVYFLLAEEDDDILSKKIYVYTNRERKKKKN